MHNNELKLNKLMNEISRKANKSFGRVKVRLAVANNLSIPQLEEKYSTFLIDYKERIYQKELALHKDKIETLKTAIENGVEVVPVVVSVPVSKVKIKEEKKSVTNYQSQSTMKEIVDNYKKTKKSNKNSEFGFNQDEVNFIINEYFYNQKGYKYIAMILEKDEKLVRKQIAQYMSEIVA